MRTNIKKIIYSNEIKEYINNFYPFDIDSLYTKEIIRYLKSIHKSFNANSKFTHVSNYIGTYDLKNPILQDGWIDKNGHWYSCESGAHEVKAQMIICFNDRLTKNYLSKLPVKNINSLIFLDSKPMPSDFLITNGWLKIQNIYKPSVIYALGKKLTRSQVNAVYNAVSVFNLNSDPLEYSQLVDYNEKYSINA